MKRLRERLLERAARDEWTAADPVLVRDYYQSVLDSVGSVVYTVNRISPPRFPHDATSSEFFVALRKPDHHSTA